MTLLSWACIRYFLYSSIQKKSWSCGLFACRWFIAVTVLSSSPGVLRCPLLCVGAGHWLTTSHWRTLTQRSPPPRQPPLLGFRGPLLLHLNTAWTLHHPTASTTQNDALTDSVIRITHTHTHKHLCLPLTAWTTQG